MATTKGEVTASQLTSLEERLDRLTAALERAAPRKRVLIARSFLHGIFVALGATIGVSIVIAVLSFFLSQLKVVPFMDQLIAPTQIEQLLPRDTEPY